MKLRHIALFLSYCGTRYHGWQFQENANSVARTLEAAVSKAVNEPIKLTGCGRTDAGVHARRYVADFFTRGGIPLDRLPNALNSMLPNDIVVFSAHDMPAGFHPIRSCVKKEYVYEIYTGKQRNPFLENRAMHYPHPLDLRLINKAAALLCGSHDFNSMRSGGTPVKSTVRTVHYCYAARSADLIRIFICADGFLYTMARTIAGTLINVSEKKFAVSEIPDILSSRERTRAGITAPSHGLYLSRIWYNTSNKVFNNICSSISDENI